MSTKSREEAQIKIACIQMEPVVADKSRNVRRSLEFIEQAASNDAKLIVLPELCNSGYVFESREEAIAVAESVPDGETSKAWAEIAARYGLHIVAGICERDGE